MLAPGVVADHSSALEPWRDEVAHASVAAVGEDPAMLHAQLLDARAAIVNRVVTIAGTSRCRRDDCEISPTDEDLRVTRPAVVLRASCATVIASRDQRAIDDP